MFFFLLSFFSPPSPPPPSSILRPPPRDWLVTRNSSTREGEEKKMSTAKILHAMARNVFFSRFSSRPLPLSLSLRIDHVKSVQRNRVLPLRCANHSVNYQSPPPPPQSTQFCAPVHGVNVGGSQSPQPGQGLVDLLVPRFRRVTPRQSSPFLGDSDPTETRGKNKQTG